MQTCGKALIASDGICKQTNKLIDQMEGGPGFPEQNRDELIELVEKTKDQERILSRAHRTKNNADGRDLSVDDVTILLAGMAEQVDTLLEKSGMAKYRIKNMGSSA